MVHGYLGPTFFFVWTPFDAPTSWYLPGLGPRNLRWVSTAKSYLVLLPKKLELHSHNNFEDFWYQYWDHISY